MARAPKVKRRSSFTTVCYAVLAVVRDVTEEGLRQFQQYDKFRDALLRDLEFVAEGRRREEQLRHRLRVRERRQKRKREP